MNLNNRFLLLGLFCVQVSFAQKSDENQRYLFLVEFEDKLFNFNKKDHPQKYLSEKAIQRRKQMAIEIDETDLPVSAFYLDDLKKQGFDIKYTSKWLNAAVVRVREKDAVLPLRIKTYVKSYTWLGTEQLADEVKPTVSWQVNRAVSNDFAVGSKKYYGAAWRQIEMIKGHEMHKLGYQGQGVDMAIFDAGFHNYTKRKLIAQDRIKYTYDLVKMENEVESDDNHGYQVMSCILANSPGTMVGTAPKVNAYLFRTEDDASETLIEELNWVKAAEIADSMGIAIISSSLGYTEHDKKEMGHAYKDMNGETTWIAKGANLAVSKGILVVNSMGNAGRSEWRYLGSPADVQTVLSIASVNKMGEKSDFSSFGPNALNQQKPNVAALGSYAVVGSSYGGITKASGTSFSTPIVAGMVACLLQAHPEKTPDQINKAVMQSGHQRFHPDDGLGFGIPNFLQAHQMLGGSKPQELQMLEVRSKKCKNQIDVGLYIPNNFDVTQEIYAQARGFFGLFGRLEKMNEAMDIATTSYVYKKIPLQGNRVKKVNFIYSIKTDKTSFQKGFSYHCKSKSIAAFNPTALINGESK